MRYVGGVTYPLQNQSCDITLSNSLLVIEPRLTSQIDVLIKPNFIKPCYAVIQLKPSYDSMQPGFVPQANYISIYVNVIDKSVKKEVKVEAECGSTARISFPIENITTLEAKYKVSISE